MTYRMELLCTATFNQLGRTIIVLEIDGIKIRKMPALRTLAAAEQSENILHACAQSTYVYAEGGSGEVVARIITPLESGQVDIQLLGPGGTLKEVDRQRAFDHCNLSDLIMEDNLLKHVYGKSVYADGTPVRLDTRELPPATAEQSEFSEFPLFAPKGTDLGMRDAERVVDRTFYWGANSKMTVVIRTTLGRVLSCTENASLAMDHVQVGDFIYLPVGGSIQLVWRISVTEQQRIVPWAIEL
ncbi:hypothetical protein [Pseudomonas sp.]|uniref:hypothetical protein n=1 Tax=Pseudomonas sp. TaxID=306 RepID=UPI001B0D8DC4|nr:hypothetical protein [Pseudomonas sp.]MBO9547883.1 hypothetical protein [Pseudomonas sp.]